jgi:hypothetical protein
MVLAVKMAELEVHPTAAHYDQEDSAFVLHSKMENLQTVKRKIGDLETWERVVVKCPQQDFGTRNSGMFVLKFVECECLDRSLVTFYNYCYYHFRKTHSYYHPNKPTALLYLLGT